MLRSVALDRIGRLRREVRIVLSDDWQWIFTAQLVAIAGTLALLKVVAILASPGEFGRFALVLAVAAGVNTLGFGPLIAWATRYYQEARERGRTPAYFRVLLVAALAEILIAFVLAVFVVRLIPGPLAQVGLGSYTVWLGVLIGISMSANEVGVAVSNAALRRRQAALFLILGRWLPVAAVVIAQLVRASSVTGYAAATLISVAGVLVVQSAWVAREETQQLATLAAVRDGFRPWGYLPALITYASPYVLWGLASYILSFGDRFVLAYFEDPATVGAYVAMAAATINVSNAVTAALSRVLEPTVYSVAGSGLDRERVARAHDLVRTSVRVIVVASVPAVGVYALFGRTIVNIFSSAAYDRYAHLLFLLLLASILFVISQQLILHGTVEKRPWAYLPAKFAHAGLLVAAMLALVPSHGLPGLILALLIANAAQVVMVAVTNRLLGVRL